MTQQNLLRAASGARLLPRLRAAGYRDETFDPAGVSSNATEPPMYQRLQATIGISLLAIGMLALAMWGHPPYWFFFLLKTCVVLGALFAAHTLWKAAPGTAPVGLLLIGIAAVNALARMRRSQWFTFDLLAAVLFAVVAVLALGLARPSRGRKA
jgi:hypothetical protein